MLPRFSPLLRLWVAIHTAFDALVRNPLRGALTGFGILVGVAAVTIVITLGEGAERAVQENIAKMGENLLTIQARASQKSGAASQKPTLTESDAEAIEREIQGIEEVAPVVDGLVRAMYQGRNSSAQAVGTTVAYFRARNYELTAGSVWEPTERSARVVLIGPTVVKELFLGEDPLGKSLRVGKHLYRVIGVLGEKGQTPFGTDQDNLIVLPISTMRSKISPGRPGEIRQIAIAAKEGVSTAELSRPIRSLMRQRHKIEEGEEDDFSVRDQEAMAQAQRGVVIVMRMLLLAIAGVSLVIGGIGVMNIMLVSVAERSREIGTRLAVGARGADILTQFLIEAVVLSLLGGAAGAAVAAATVPPLEAYFGWPLSVSLRALVIASVVSITIGVVFGLLPARRAARLDPVEALRRE